MAKSTDEELLRIFLVERDVQCPACGYALRDCESNRCPECGAALRLGVVERRSPAGLWWALGLAGCALSAVMSGWLLIALLRPLGTIMHDPRVIQLVNAGFSPVSDAPNWEAIIVSAFLTLCAAGAAMSLIVSRRHFTLLGRWCQVLIGVTCFASPVLLLGLLSFLVRYVL